MRNYERLSVEDFGRVLLDSGDLDPVYIALHKMELPWQQRNKWLLAYWCFYHSGVASWLSERKDFFPAMYVAALNVEPSPLGGRWPRGHERRHFRGGQAVRACNDLSNQYDKAEDMVERIADLPSYPVENGKVPFSLVAERAATHTGFGPWISFKIADMLDRLDILPVDFSEADVFMFKDPKEAAIRLWLHKQGLDVNARPKDEMKAIRKVVAHLKDHFAETTAPPLHDRKVDLQEIETILCKWKSHMNGHYPLLNDTTEIRAGLEGWGETANLMKECMPSWTITTPTVANMTENTALSSEQLSRARGPRTTSPTT